MENFINAQMTKDSIIDDRAPILFDTIIINRGFTYNDGHFLSNENGNYIIIYHLNIEGSEASPVISTSLLINGNTYYLSIGNRVQGQYSGSTVAYLKKGDEISLINSTDEEIEISFANIIIYGREEEKCY